MGRNLRTRLDLIKPDIRKHVIEKQVSQAKPKGAIAGNVRQLFIGQAVTIVPSKLRNDRFYEGHICVSRDHNSLQAACEKLQVSV